MPAPDDDQRPGVPQWVVTYGDMMSLLLTFFIMIVSMSEIRNQGHARAMLDAIRRVFGPTQGDAGVPGESLQRTSMLNERSSRGLRAEGETRRASRDSPGAAGAHRTLERINHGTMITLGGPARFGRFETTLTPELKQSLDVVAEVVGPRPNRIMVRGHASPEPLPPDTDLVTAALGAAIDPGASLPPIGLRVSGGVAIRDQFDLSFARARQVAEYLVSKGIDRRRLMVSAAGDAEQRLPTRRRTTQKFNRRVDVFLLDSYITPPQPGRARN